MRKVLKYVTNPQSLLICSIFLFILFFSALSFLRHDNFHSRRLDLGNMDQTVWNVIQGNGFTLTDPMGTSQLSRLAVHADYLLILLSPFYLIWSNPKMLLLIQVVIISLGALPIYWIASESIKSKKIAFLFVLIYLWYPPMGRMMLHDFHAVALSTTFLLYAYWFMEKKNFILFSIFAVLAALGKEQVWITIAMMGIYIALWKKSKIFGITTFIISCGIFYVLFWVAIPSVTPAKQHFALSYLSEYGGSLNEIISHLITQPFSIVFAMVRFDRLVYYFQLLFPLGFLSILSPFPLLFSLESLLINSLSSNTLMRSIDYQYTSTITPFIFISAIYGYTWLMKTLRHRHKVTNAKYSKFSVLSLLSCLLLSLYLWGEFPVGKSQWFWHFISPVSERQSMQKIADSIDSSYSVSATNNIGSHFSQRKYLYNFPIYADKADYTVVYLGDTYAWPSGDAQRITVKEMLQNREYLLIAQEGNFFAFKKI